MASTWHTFAQSSQLSLPFTLTNGQCFGWRREGDAFVGVLGGRVLSLRESDTQVQALEHTAASTAAVESSAVAAATGVDASSAAASSPGVKRKRPLEPGMASSPLPAAVSASSSASAAGGSAGGGSSGVGAETTPLELALRDYFRLDTDLAPLYSSWAGADARMAAITARLPAMRLLRQPPWECLISFICSSNNNIPRITQMLDKLRVHYGPLLATVDGRPYHAFPTPEALAGASEVDLRALGLGYRAKFVRAAAGKVVELGGETALLALRSQPLPAVRTYLQQFDGVGPKVGDCVALFSCEQGGAIPVDTHVWSIACCYYDPQRQLAEAKSLTPTVYDRVGALFRDRFGPWAGWAHCLLFAAELPSYRALLPPELGQDMAAFRAKEKEAKAVKKVEAAARKRARLEAAAAAGGAGAGAGAGAASGAADSSSAGGAGALDTSGAGLSLGGYSQEDEEAEQEEEQEG